MCIHKLLFLAICGAAGTLARFGLTGLVHRWYGEPTPIATIAVNGLGCLIFGLIWGLTEHRFGSGHAVSLALLVGFCGALTTFSSFGFDSHQLAHHSGLFWMGGYIAAQNIIGIMLLFMGIGMAQLLTRTGF